MQFRLLLYLYININKKKEEYTILQVYSLWSVSKKSDLIEGLISYKKGVLEKIK